MNVEEITEEILKQIKPIIISTIQNYNKKDIQKNNINIKDKKTPLKYRKIKNILMNELVGKDIEYAYNLLKDYKEYPIKLIHNENIVQDIYFE